MSRAPVGERVWGSSPKPPANQIVQIYAGKFVDQTDSMTPEYEIWHDTVWEPNFIEHARRSFPWERFRLAEIKA